MLIIFFQPKLAGGFGGGTEDSRFSGSGFEGSGFEESESARSELKNILKFKKF